MLRCHALWLRSRRLVDAAVQYAAHPTKLHCPAPLVLALLQLVHPPNLFRAPCTPCVQPPGMHNPGLPPGISPQLLQQLQMQQQGLQRPMPPPMHHPPSQQQLSSAQLMAALGLAQGGMPQQGLR